MRQHRGGSRILSRGVGGFENYVDLFSADQIDFPSSRKALKRPWFGQILKKKKQAKKVIFRNFLETFDQKSHFGARSPLKLIYIGAEGAYRKLLGSLTKDGYLKRGNPLGRQGVESLGKEASVPPPNPPLRQYYPAQK